MISIAFFYLTQIITVVLSFAYMPIMAFVGYELIYFLHHESRWWINSVPDLRYSFFFSMLVLIMAVVTRARGEGLRVLAAPSFRWLYLLVFLYAATYFYSLAPALHLTTLEAYLKSIMVVSAALVLCRDRTALNYIMAGYVLGAAYIGYYIFEVGRNSGNRVEGIGTVDSPDVNGLAAMLVPAAILALHFFWTNKKPSYRFAVVIAGGLITNALVLMNSRGAYLGLGMGAAYYMYRLFGANLGIRNLRLKVIAVGLLGVIAMLSIMDKSAFDRVFSIQSESALSAEQETGSTRVFFWMAALRMTIDHPLGRGAYAFHLSSDRYIPEGIDTGGSRRRAPHSSWFQTLSEVGFAGLFIFVMVLWSTYTMLRRCRSQLRQTQDSNGFFTIVAIEASCVGYLICMTFIDRMRAEGLHWLILFAAAAYQIYFLHAKSPVKRSASSVDL
ncbi:O-antigen ligase family protein [Congregibacter litoralis]|uniref:O-Antigen ligase n=1 Tax=Congregibacter litoralis KT71 TaxID=314285 RepID=A4A542_9GAMM|nr:O-antigen ligase family protein [Congregibacter litoralis]EAQ98913.1 O-Antigen ligase [Congregibacter litoralis KT71]